MKQNEIANNLGSEWDRPNGFFARLRVGDFDSTGAARVLDQLAHLDLGDTENLERDLARQLWYLPLFCQWQEGRVADENGDVQALKAFTTEAINALEDKIGVP